jgi:toxin YoeB
VEKHQGRLEDMREVLLSSKAVEDLQWWIKNDKRTALKLFELFEEIAKTPFAGKGKPEALKHGLSGCWSRRITDEHRLVYEVTETYARVLSCRFHYE